MKIKMQLVIPIDRPSMLIKVYDLFLIKFLIAIFRFNLNINLNLGKQLHSYAKYRYAVWNAEKANEIQLLFRNEQYCTQADSKFDNYANLVKYFKLYLSDCKRPAITKLKSLKFHLNFWWYIVITTVIMTIIGHRKVNEIITLKDCCALII